MPKGMPDKQDEGKEKVNQQDKRFSPAGSAAMQDDQDAQSSTKGVSSAAMEVLKEQLLAQDPGVWAEIEKCSCEQAIELTKFMTLAIEKLDIKARQIDSEYEKLKQEVKDRKERNAVAAAIKARSAEGTHTEIEESLFQITARGKAIIALLDGFDGYAKEEKLAESTGNNEHQETPHSQGSRRSPSGAAN